MSYIKSQCQGFWCSIKKTFYGINNRGNLPKNQEKKTPTDEERKDQKLEKPILIQKQRELHSNVT